MPTHDQVLSFHCMGCGSSLARAESLFGEPACERGRDRTGSYFRCPACGGQNYYIVREGRGLVLIGFHEARASSSHYASSQPTFLSCIGAVLGVVGVTQFISEATSASLVPYPPVVVFASFLAWGAVYLISLVCSAPREDPSHAG
jgi:hypothetical protein